MKRKVHMMMLFVLTSIFCATAYAMQKDEKVKKVVLVTDKKEQSLKLKKEKVYGNLDEKSFLTEGDFQRIQREADDCGCCLCMCITCLTAAKLGALLVVMVFSK